MKKPVNLIDDTIYDHRSDSDKGIICKLPQCPTCKEYPTYNLPECPFCGQGLIYDEIEEAR